MYRLLSAARNVCVIRENTKTMAGIPQDASRVGIDCGLVVEFECELQNAWIAAGARDLAEITGVGVVQVAGVVELCVISQVEGLRSELELGLPR